MHIKRSSLVLVFLASVVLSVRMSAQVVPVYSVTSPEAAGLGTFGAVPVSYFTGVPGISVPLHEAKFGKYVIPISADYHLGSVRPNDPPGCLGLGWTLVADGVISRSVRGVCDEKRSQGASVGNGYYWHTADMGSVVADTSLFAGMTQDHMRGSHTGDDSWFELSADEFSFSFLGYSGNFYLDVDGEWVVVSDQDIRVEFDPTTGFADCGDLESRIPGISNWRNRSQHDCFFMEFTLVTPDGVRCTFGGVGATDFSVPYYGRDNGEIIATSWHLKRIATPEGYAVNFSYLSDISEESIMVDIRYVPGSIVLHDPTGTIGAEYISTVSKGRSAFTGFLLYSAQLARIETPNERISFEYHEDLRYGDAYANHSGEALYWDRSLSGGPYRIDRYSLNHQDPALQFRSLFPSFGGIGETQIRQRMAANLRSYFLYRISIDDLRSGLDRSIFFSYDHHNRRKVDRIAWRAGLDPVGPDYAEGAGVMVPVYRIPENLSGTDMPEYRFAYDTLSMPRGYVFPRTDRWGYYNGTSWSPSDSLSSQGYSPISSRHVHSETLTEVTYPTGGRSVYEYENHTYSRAVQQPGAEPVRSAGAAGGLRVRSISNYDRSGILVGRKVYRYTTSMDSSESSGIRGPESPVYVAYKSPMVDSPEDTLLLVMQSEAGFPPAVTRMNSPAVGYSTVIEESLDSYGQSNGYTEYHFSNYGTDIFGESHDDEPAICSCNVGSGGEGLPYTSGSSGRGHLLRKDVHAADGTLVRREDTHYAKVRDITLTTAVQRLVVFCPDPGDFMSASAGWLVQTHAFSYLPASTESTQYDQPSSMTVREETDYNSSRLPTEKRTQLADGRFRVQAMDYAYGHQEYGWMRDAHVLTPLVSTTVTQDGLSRTISQHLANASSDSRAMPYPDLVQQSTSEHPEPWTVYEALSADSWGNPREIVEKGRHSVLRWGHEGQVLSLRVDGMTYGEYSALSDLPSGAMAYRYLYGGGLLLSSEERPDGFVTSYDYDDLGRLSGTWFSEAASDGSGEARMMKMYEYHLYDGADNGDVRPYVDRPALASAPVGPSLDLPVTYHASTGHAYDIPLMWRKAGPNEESRYRAILVAEDTLTVGIGVPVFACDEDVAASSAPVMELSARMLRYEGDDLVPFLELPFRVDMGTLQCRTVDGRDSVVVEVPPGSYMLEYRGLSHVLLPHPDQTGLSRSSAESSLHSGSSTARFRLECLPLLPGESLRPVGWNSITERVSRDGSRENAMVTRSYKDDFGRDLAVHQVEAGPDGETLVSLREYDGWGRDALSWLPAVTDFGVWHADERDIRTMVGETYGDSAPYSMTVYESSPLNRVLESYGPGAEWHDEGRCLRTSYFVNAAGGMPELSCLDVSVSFAGPDGTCSVSSSGHVPAGSLSVVRTEDEDCRITYEFSDRLGRKLLSRQLLADGSPSDGFLDTYYVYDGMDRLVAVLPPALSSMLGGGTAVSWEDIDRYAFLYRYDGRGRQCMRKTPGAGWVQLVNDGADRVLFEQNGRMRQEGRTLCRLYDIHGRECVVLSCSRTLRSGETFDAIPYVRYVGAHGTFGGYDFGGRALPLDDVQILSLTFYDTYSFETDLSVGLPGAQALYAVVNAAPTGQPTGMWHAQFDGGDTDGDGVWTSLRYDARGRMAHGEKSWTQGGFRIEDISYDFLGNVISRHVSQVHVEGADAVTEDLAYEYDHQGRLLSVSHSLDGGSPVTVLESGYDSLGRLASVSRGSSPSLYEQRSYDLRSQLTSLGSDLFTERIYYNEVRTEMSDPRYGGSISSVEWMAGTDGVTRAYDYSYDPLGRLTAARYCDDASGSVSDGFGAAFTYDVQGNVLSLSRRCVSGGTARWMDVLSLTYDGNRLARVEDAAPAGPSRGMGFVDGAHLEEEYGYDASGNVVFDLNRGISAVSYDITDHPASMTSGDVQTTFGYLASGDKTRMSVSSAEGESVTEYRDGHVWRDGHLAFILFDGGYIDCESDGCRYVFYLKDHLGSNRVVATADGEILQVNHYYPYGMAFPDVAEVADSGQSWRFSGKELLEPAAWDLYDFEARLYDPVLGRFLRPDPMAEKYGMVTPYGYCMANPLMYVDDDGQVPLLANAVAAVLSAAVDFGVQVATYCAGGLTVKDALAKVDYMDVGLSAVEGFMTLGSSNAKKAAVEMAVLLASSLVDVTSEDGFEVNGYTETTVGCLFSAISSFTKVKPFNIPIPTKTANKAKREVRNAAHALGGGLSKEGADLVGDITRYLNEVKGDVKTGLEYVITNLLPEALNTASNVFLIKDRF